MKIFIITFIMSCFFINSSSYATDAIIESQMEVLDLSSFVREGENYTKEVFPEADVDKLLNSALSGQIDNKVFYSGVLKLLGKEVTSSITLMRQYFNNSCST